MPVSPLSQRAELLHALRDSTPRALVALDQLLPLVRDARGALGAEDPLASLFYTKLADVVPAAPTLPLPPMAQAPRCPAEPQDHAIDLLPALAACQAPAPRAAPALDAVAALNYTGGTTGLPKGCIHTQGDMVDMAAAFGAVSLPLDEQAVMLGFFPEFWIAGENLCLIFPVFYGTPLVLLARWDAETFMAAVERYRVTNASMLVDSVVEVMDHPRVSQYSLRSCGTWACRPSSRSSTWTTAPLAGTDRLDHRRNRLGHDRDPPATPSRWACRGRSRPALPAHLRRPAGPGTEFKICDFDSGALLPPGTEGELCVRTPTLLKGYWNKPEATRESLRGGWFHTGDIGVIDTQGYLHYLAGARRCSRSTA